MQKFIYIGNKFYIESGTIMSSIYRILEDGEIVERSDWGKVQLVLGRGEEIHIRPAYPEEMQIAQARLDEILEERKNANNP
jgi:hypothetical protein